jgi:hypothetical protein
MRVASIEPDTELRRSNGVESVDGRDPVCLASEEMGVRSVRV